jgi:hypothetical protein
MHEVQMDWTLLRDWPSNPFHCVSIYFTRSSPLPDTPSLFCFLQIQARRGDAACSSTRRITCSLQPPGRSLVGAHHGTTDSGCGRSPRAGGHSRGTARRPRGRRDAAARTPARSAPRTRGGTARSAARRHGRAPFARDDVGGRLAPSRPKTSPPVREVRGGGLRAERRAFVARLAGTSGHARRTVVVARSAARLVFAEGPAEGAPP